MTSVAIPLERIASRAIRPRLFSGNQEGVLGGIDLAIPRLGDRFAVDVTTTQLRQDAAARLLIAALTEATTGDARIALPQYDMPRKQQMGSSVVVAGAGQAGSSLAVRGATPGATTVRGQYFNIVHAGRGYLFMATAQVIVSAAGTATIPIWPMLRFLTIDGEPVTFGAFIEGRLVGFDKGATFVRNRVDPLQFAIEERA